MRAIIMGCGRIGERLSNLLIDEGHSVVVIDDDPRELARLGPNFRGEKVRGVGFDRDVLLRAGIEETEAFAATSRSDNANIVAARIARQVFKVPRVIARIQEPRKVEIYRRLGLMTISPAHWGAQRISELLTHSDMAPLMTVGNGDVSVVAVEIPPHLEGRIVRDLMVPGEVIVFAITREDSGILPTTGTELYAGDVLHMAVLAGSMDRLDAMLGLSTGGD